MADEACYKYCRPGVSGDCGLDEECKKVNNGQTYDYFYVGTTAYGLCSPM
jgi:hypothetical protein